MNKKAEDRDEPLRDRIGKLPHPKTAADALKAILGIAKDKRGHVLQDEHIGWLELRLKAIGIIAKRGLNVSERNNTGRCLLCGEKIDAANGHCCGCNVPPMPASSKGKYRCAVRGVVACEFEKQGACTFDAGKGVGCANKVSARK